MRSVFFIVFLLICTKLLQAIFVFYFLFVFFFKLDYLLFQTGLVIKDPIYAGIMSASSFLFAKKPLKIRSKIERISDPSLSGTLLAGSVFFSSNKTVPKF